MRTQTFITHPFALTSHLVIETPGQIPVQKPVNCKAKPRKGKFSKPWLSNLLFASMIDFTLHMRIEGIHSED